MKVDYKKFKLFEYEQSPSKDDVFTLGDVVIHKDTNEVGVIIQAHGNNEYRTDMFGNCCIDNIELASLVNIGMNRPNLLSEQID